MKRYLALALAALALVVAAPSAFATRVIFDPPLPPPSGFGTPTGTDCTLASGPPSNLTDYAPCNISKLDTPYSVEFMPCSDVQGAAVPTGATWCLWMNNVTRHAAGDFTFEFEVPTGGSGSDADGLVCGSIYNGVVTDNCPSTLPNAGSLFSVSFFARPPVPNRFNFYLFTDFVTSPGYADVTVSVPEPGELGLFGFGLLLLGVGLGRQKWRRMGQNNAAT